jgi:hypothetical protein
MDEGVWRSICHGMSFTLFVDYCISYGLSEYSSFVYTYFNISHIKVFGEWSDVQMMILTVAYIGNRAN